MMVGSKLERVQDLDLYRPADFDGKVLRLHYAQAEDPGPYLGLVAAQGEVYVQFWFRAGDPPVEVSFGEDGTESVIPELLRNYL